MAQKHGYRAAQGRPPGDTAMLPDPGQVMAMGGQGNHVSAEAGSRAVDGDGGIRWSQRMHLGTVRLHLLGDLGEIHTALIELIFCTGGADQDDGASGTAEAAGIGQNGGRQVGAVK